MNGLLRKASTWSCAKEGEKLSQVIAANGAFALDADFPNSERG